MAFGVKANRGNRSRRNGGDSSLRSSFTSDCCIWSSIPTRCGSSGRRWKNCMAAARFVILYVLTGVAGVYGSYFYHPDSISAGASGAIFGLFGVLLVFGIRYRRFDSSCLQARSRNGRASGDRHQSDYRLHHSGRRQLRPHRRTACGRGAGRGRSVSETRRAEDARVFEGVQIGLLALIAVCFYEVA